MCPQNPYYYHYDGLGSVTNLTGSSGVTAESYSYDVFGKPNITSTIGNTRMFTGREYDLETGLYYYRARYYSPAIGRFLQRDPLGYKAGINLYSYCGNNSVNSVDPRGLDTVLVPGVYRFGLGGDRQENWSSESSVRKNLENTGENVIEFNWSGYLFERQVYSSLTSKLITTEQQARANNSEFNVVAHSWGAVVALEALKAAGLRVDNFITIGAPLTGFSGRGSGINNWVNIFSITDSISWGGSFQFEVDSQKLVISFHILDFENHIVGRLVQEIIKKEKKK